MTLSARWSFTTSATTNCHEQKQVKSWLWRWKQNACWVLWRCSYGSGSLQWNVPALEISSICKGFLSFGIFQFESVWTCLVSESLKNCFRPIFFVHQPEASFGESAASLVLALGGFDWSRRAETTSSSTDEKQWSQFQTQLTQQASPNVLSGGCSSKPKLWVPCWGWLSSYSSLFKRILGCSAR